MDVIIVGAGASGMSAAIECAKSGAKVTLLDSNSKAGRKLLVTGNGRCNAANMIFDADKYNKSGREFAEKVFEKVGLEKILSFLEETGIPTRDIRGYIYPYNEEASYVVRAFEKRLSGLGVRLKFNNKVERISYDETCGKFKVTSNGWDYSADRVILSCGSSASRVEGADGSGYFLAESLGHSTVSLKPALVPLVCEGKFFSRWSGVRVRGSVSAYSNGRLIGRDEGQLQLTQYGISGIPVFNISGAAATALSEGEETECRIDFAPDYSREQIEAMVSVTGKEAVYSILPKKLADVIVSEGCPEKTADRIKCFCLRIKDTLGREHAQVMTGGIPVNEIDVNTMESGLVKGLYFSGEIIDVDGVCGGYNLMFAWATGIIAGMSAGNDKD
ncbi:MAG: NAD(P)/FAD-dependent oxidoreductase [Lachnospiraceae bacterium]|jgi:predicted Rossmann fold flavoprotein